jgi:hypothetical protein
VTSSTMRLVAVGLPELEILDEPSFEHVGVFRALRAWLGRSAHRFLVPEDAPIAFARTLFLNLAYFDPEEPSDVLPDRTLPADVLAHVAWHAIAADRVWPTVEGRLLGEAIASAFDLYLVGRLLGRSPESDFLQTQVPALADAAAEAGLDDETFEALLADVARDPDRAFEDMRALLVDVLRDLMQARGAVAALDALARRDGHRFAPLLHHFELASWVLAARATPDLPADGAKDPARDPVRVDAELRAATSSIDWLESTWVRPGAPDVD